MWPYFNFSLINHKSIDYFPEMVWSIMSGDSPNRDDFFEFPKDGRSSPIPTSSKDIGVQSGNTGNAVAQASVLVDPKEQKDRDDKDKDKEDDNILNSPTSHNSSHDDKDNDKTLPLEDSYTPDKDKKDNKDRGDDKGDKHDKTKDADKKPNGDRLDGVWLPKDSSKHGDVEDDNDDNNCLVQCLYYSMQCCDCTIV